MHRICDCKIVQPLPGPLRQPHLINQVSDSRLDVINKFPRDCPVPAPLRTRARNQLTVELARDVARYRIGSWIITS